MGILYGSRTTVIHCSIAVCLLLLWLATTSLTVDAFTTSLPGNYKSLIRNNRQPRKTSSSSFLLRSVPDGLDTLTSGLASICRLPHGITVQQQAKEDDDTRLLMVLYDVENNGECRLVRERLTELDRNFVVVPASGRVVSDPTYPYALPPDTPLPALAVTNKKDGTYCDPLRIGKEDILAFLNENVVSSSSKEKDDSAPWDGLANLLATGFRIGRGSQVSSAALQAPLPMASSSELPSLVLYNYEGNQFCRLVREVLHELDLPYECRSTGKESPRRTELATLTGGSSQCPYLLDGDIQLSESKDIVEYLYETYASYPPPSEVLQFASENVLPLAEPLFGWLAKQQAGEQADLEMAKAQIEKETTSAAVVVYTYEWSPFSWETTALLDRMNVEYQTISLGKEWIPGLLEKPDQRAALLELTGQSSLPQIFVNGEWIGGLYNGLLPALQNREFQRLCQGNKATTSSST